MTRPGRIAAWLVVLGAYAGCHHGDQSQQGAVDPEDTFHVDPTQGGGALRTSWYPDEPGLAPSSVASAAFGPLFATAVTGQVYAQPLVSQGTVLVATESNAVYGLDATTGAIRWSKVFGTPVASTDLACGDLAPELGITGTPVIDPATNVAYLFSTQYVSGTSGPVAWYAHALAVGDGAEQPGFPVLIAGAATNGPTQVFAPRYEAQRPGLLLLDGVVYAGFSAHCDKKPYAGWIVGVSTSGRLATLWTTEADPAQPSGGGVWQSGGGLVSDGPGQIVFTTGNQGSAPGPLDGASPPATLGESVVRLAVQPDGSLRATDFFSPYDAASLDKWDGEIGSAAPMALPPEYFGTDAHPHLLVAAGKQGYVYLLDGDHLGGIGTGASGRDDVLGRIGPYGGVWSKPAVWPGDGGYVYLPTASPGKKNTGSSGFLQVFRYDLDGAGAPTLALAAKSADAFGFGSSAPVVTSDGVTPGSALLWMIRTAGGTGNGAQLRAYDAVPANGALALRFSASIGQSSKFASPGVGGGRIYVGTRDGHVLGFGLQSSGDGASVLLRGTGLDFGAVTLGTTSRASITVTATETVSVTGVSISSGAFTLDPATPAIPALPATLQAGDTLTVPVVYAPASLGMSAATLTVANSGTPLTLSVSGTGRSPNAQLLIEPASVSFGGTTVGGEIDESVTLSNIGGAPLTILSVDAPDAPFGVRGAPAAGDVLAPGDEVAITLTFAPREEGMDDDAFAIDTTGGSASIGVSGVCVAPGYMTIDPPWLDFGAVELGDTATASFVVTNAGSSPITITKSKPPAAGVFFAATDLPEGTVLDPGVSVTETVTFTPAAAGGASDTWVLTSDDGSGEQTVELSGSGGPDD